jgi:hypothetical protein
MRQQRLVRISVGLVVASLAWWWVPGWVGYVNYLRVLPGMSQRQVEYMLGGQGAEVSEDQVTTTVDYDAPIDSPKRIKRVVEGDKYFKWGNKQSLFPICDTYILVSFKNGVVYGKHYWTPSL